MPSPGRRVGGSTRVPNYYGATKVATTQEDQPLLSSNRGHHFQTQEQRFGHVSRRDRKPRMTVFGEDKQQSTALLYSASMYCT
jgi:hypothetical protein